MAIRQQSLYKVWDGKSLINENINFLLRRTNPVSFPLNEESKQIVKDLEDTYIAIPCAGIAANQIGYNTRIFVGMEFVDEETNHTRVSKMLIATQFNEGAGSATLTEYGIIYTSSSDIASFQVALSGLSGERIAVVIDPSVAGTATAVALDTFTSSINTLSAQQQTMRGYDMLTNNYRKVVDCFGFEEGSTTGVNTLFTIEQTLAQQTYFAYSMGNYGFDLISWYVVKEFLETRAKLLSQRRSYKFDPRTQYLQMYPHVDTDTARFYGVVGCYLEQPLVEVIKEPWVYQYALALTKIGVARVRGKYGGTNLFGGGTIEYDSLLSEGNETKDKLEQQLFEGSAPGFGDAMPPMFFVG